MIALSPEEEARCAAMAERAGLHAAEADRFARQLAALQAKHPAAVEALALVLAIHICERARCAALGCSPPSVADTLDRHGILTRAALNQPLSPLRRVCN